MKTWQQLLNSGAAWFRQTSLAMRAVLAAAVAVIALCLVWYFQNPAQNHFVEIFDSRELSADEISLIQVAFGRAGLNDYEVLGKSITVKRQDRAKYLKALADNDAIPEELSYRQNDSKFDFFLSKDQQRQKLLEQKKRQIRDMVVQMNFVQHAMVDYDETRSSSPFVDKQRSAIVTIMPKGVRVLEPFEIKAVRDTVRGAVAGLTASEVVITDLNANRSYSGAQDFGGESNQPMVHVKNVQEAKYEMKIRNALAAYPGVRVNVEVLVNPVLKQRLKQRQFDGEPIVLSRTIQTTSQRRPAIETGDTMRLAGTNRQARIPRWDDSELENSIETIDTMSRGSVETTERAGLTVNSVRVSIGVPERCVEHLCRRQIGNLPHPDTAQEAPAALIPQRMDEVFVRIRKDIQQRIRPLLPQADPLDEQIVVMMDPQIPLTQTVSDSNLTSAAATTHWLAKNWRTCALLAFGLVALVILRIQPKSIAETDSSTRTNAVSLVTIPRTNERPPLHQPAEGPAVEPSAPGDSQEMSAQLDRWCRDNPDAAAATIRQWLDKAS